MAGHDPKPRHKRELASAAFSPGWSILNRLGGLVIFKSLLESGLYFLEQSKRAGGAIRGQEDHT
jgi:hypothetical protein